MTFLAQEKFWIIPTKFLSLKQFFYIGEEGEISFFFLKSIRNPQDFVPRNPLIQHIVCIQMDVICPTIRPSIHPPRQLSTRSLLIHIVEFATLWTTTDYSKLTRFSPAIRCLLSPYPLPCLVPPQDIVRRAFCIFSYVTWQNGTQPESAVQAAAEHPPQQRGIISLYSIQRIP